MLLAIISEDKRVINACCIGDYCCQLSALTIPGAIVSPLAFAHIPTDLSPLSFTSIFTFAYVYFLVQIPRLSRSRVWVESKSLRPFFSYNQSSLDLLLNSSCIFELYTSIAE